MKKIILIICLCFLLTGCYDNIELNDLNIITGVGIDYEDDEYIVTFEILNNNSSSKEEMLKSYTISNTGKTISETFRNVSYKADKSPYLAHLKTVVLSESVIEDHLEDIADYLIRSNIRESFNLVTSKDISPKDLLSKTTESVPVVSLYIVNLIENEKYNNNLAIKETYEKVYSKLASKNYDIILNSVAIKDDELTLDNSVIFKDFKYQTTLSKKESSLYNLLTNNVMAMLFQKEYEEGLMSISINSSKSEFTVKKDKIIIDCELVAKILENNANFNLKDEKMYKKLNKDFSEVIENDIKEFISTLQKNKSDILGFSDKYYKSTRKSNDNLWLTSDVEVNVNLKINTKGFIFERDNHE